MNYTYCHIATVDVSLGLGGMAFSISYKILGMGVELFQESDFATGGLWDMILTI
jgi:hypothetical protein